MKKVVRLLQIVFLGIAFCLCVGSVSAKTIRNSGGRIDGIVWGSNRTPVSDVYVELQNELFSTLSRVRTTSSGRFSFSVTRGGNYILKVLTVGTNYLSTSQVVEIVNFTPFDTDNEYVDIYLKLDPRLVSSNLPNITEAVFVQEIPDEARKLYESGVKKIGNGNDKGIDEIEQALQIFPNYFNALNTLGRTYVQRKEYQKSLSYLIRSIDINQRSFSSFYSLAYACYQLNHLPEAIEAGRAATIIQAESVNAQLLYGTALRVSGAYEKAEKALLKADSLSKNAPVPQVHYQLALLYNKQNRNKEAADQLEIYLKLNPDAEDKNEIKSTIAKLRKSIK